MGFNSGFKGLIYFVIKLFGRVAAYLAKHRLQAPWWWFS